MEKLSCNSLKAHTCGSPLTSQTGLETTAVSCKWSNTLVLYSLLRFTTLLVGLPALSSVTLTNKGCVFFEFYYKPTFNFKKF